MKKNGTSQPVQRRRRRRSLKLADAARQSLRRISRRTLPGDRELSTDPAIADLAPEIAPDGAKSPGNVTVRHGIEVLQIGWRWLPTRTGHLPLLRGIEAIRVKVTSPIPLTAMQIRIDGRSIREVPATPRPDEPDPSSRSRTYIFNEWIDFRGLPPGFHKLQLFFAEQGLHYRSYEELIHIDDEDWNDRDCGSGAVVALEPGPDEGLEERINALPSVIYPAGRSLLPRPPQRVLVIRADQLGDLVISVPAIRRLRELLPKAELVGLVSPVNRGLAESLLLFDAVATADFPYDPIRKRRLMPLDSQRALRQRLAPFGFDLAIDLGLSADSRPLLRLSGAPFTVGFGTHQFPWMSLGIDVATPDPANGKQRASHATLLLMLVEALGATLRHKPIVQPLPKADPAILAKFGLTPGRYAVIHSGARLRMKRWPIGSCAELARLVIENTNLAVVLVADSEATAEAALVEAAGLPPDRFQFVTGPLTLDELEGLIAHCIVLVGNDSGPKHLAALRGVKVVSVHMGQVNWSEWGQEGDGLIVTRHVPCYGCGIEDDRDCGKELACLTHIRPAEVFSAVEKLLGSGAAAEAAAAR